MGPDLVVAIVAVFISGIALAISLWQMAVTRKHNRITLRPMLCGDDEQTNHKVWTASLCNKGLGPALLTRCRVLVDGNEVEDFDQAIAHVGLPAFNSISSRTLGQNSVIPAGAVERIFCIDLKEADPDFRRRMNRVSVAIDYRSAYSEEFTL